MVLPWVLWLALVGCGGGDAGNDSGSADVPVCSARLVGSAPTDGLVTDVVVAGDYAYVAHDGVGVQILDIRPPAEPVEVGFFPMVFRAIRMELVGELLYVTTVERGVSILDVSNPAWPVTIGSMDFDGQTFGLDVEGGRAVVANMGEGLRVLDVSDPTAPVLQGSLGLDSGWVRDVAIHGDRVYAAVGENGLQVADLSNPASPQWVGGTNRPGWAFDLAREGDRLYLSDSTLGLRIFGLEGVEPELLGTYHSDRLAAHARVVGTTVYQSLREEGLRVLDVSDPGAIEVVDRFSQWDTWATDVAGGYAYLAAGVDGLQIVELCASSGVEVGATPGTVGPAVSACGDGVTDAGEQCDDADRSDGDGCSGSCQLEPGWTCDTSGRPTICDAPADWELEVEHNGLSASLLGDPYVPLPTSSVLVETVDLGRLFDQGWEPSLLESVTVDTVGCGTPGDGCLATVPMNGFSIAEGAIGARVGSDPEGEIAPTLSWMLSQSDALALDTDVVQQAYQPAYAFRNDAVRLLSGLVGDARGEVWDPDELLCRGVTFVWLLDGIQSFSGVTVDPAGLPASVYYLDQEGLAGPDGDFGTPDDDPSALLAGLETDLTGIAMLVPDASCGSTAITEGPVDASYSLPGGTPDGFTADVGWVPGTVTVLLVDWTDLP